MPICKKKKVLFIHVPKCAGTSIAKSLNMYSENNFPANMDILYGIHDNIVLQSLCLEYYNNYINEDLNDYTILTCVRNPYERVLSDYKWCDRGFNNILDFCKFIKTTIKIKKKYDFMLFDSKYYINHLLPQYEYINNTSLKVNILHIENINESFNKLFPDTILCHENKTHHTDYLSFFKDKEECIQIINEIYKIDFEKFGYDML